MNKFFLLTFLFLVSVTNSIAIKKDNVSSQSDVSAIEYYEVKSDVKEIELQILHIKDELYEDKEELKVGIQDFKTLLRDQKDNTYERINIYVFSIATILAIIAWAVNFFGKTAIKKRVEEIIEDTAQSFAENKTNEYLNNKINDGYVSSIIRGKAEIEVKQLLKELQDKGNKAITDIKQKGNEVINSMVALPPPKPKQNELNEDLSNEEIIDRDNKNLANELFNLAFDSSSENVKVSLYQNVINLEPNNLSALNNIGVALNNLGKYESALDYFKKAIDKDDKYVFAYVNLSNSYGYLRMYDEALKNAEIAIELEPQSELGFTAKGYILTYKGEFEKANEALTHAIKLNPNSPEAWFNMGLYNEKIGKYTKAEENYLKSIDLNISNLSLPYNNLAVVYRRLKQFDKAMSSIEKARKINSENKNLDGTLALIYADQGNDEKFFKHLEIALQKGCPVWDYIDDTGFDKYRDSERLKLLIDSYRKD